MLSPAPGGFIVDDPQPGGFVVEEDIQPGGFVAEDSQPGGFVAEDDIQSGGFVLDADECEDVYMDSIAESASTNQDENWIPLSLIPHALQLLDLQPDDEDVLGVFRHAASGWEDKSRSTARSDTPDEQYVSRKDWRAVCAALLDTAVGDEEDLPPRSKQASDEGGDLTPLESSEFGDEYQGSEPESESSGGGDDASDDEYQEGGFMTTDTKGKKSLKSAPTRTRTSRKSKRSLSAPDDDSDDDNQGTRPLTARQRLECRRAFALFFPSIPDAQLDKQRIMIKDITRVAKLLKEKMTADEVSPIPPPRPSIPFSVHLVADGACGPDRRHARDVLHLRRQVHESARL